MVSGLRGNRLSSFWAVTKGNGQPLWLRRPTVGIGGGDGVDLRDVEGGGGRWRVQRLLGGRLGLVQEDAGLPLEHLEEEEEGEAEEGAGRGGGVLTWMVRQ